MTRRIALRVTAKPCRLIDPRCHDAIQGLLHYSAADHRPAPTYLGQGGVVAVFGMGSLNGE